MHKKLLVFGILFCVISCSQDEGITLYKEMVREGLSSTPVVFQVSEEAMKPNRKNVFIRIQNDNSYPFTNIFLIATLTAGDKKIVQDTLEFAMAAPDGTWLGSGFNEVKESKLWWKEGVLFPMERPVVIKISQAMRNNGKANGVVKLEGIISLGISIEDQLEK
jgi:gliding motility-associated lipoprotein GldH